MLESSLGNCRHCYGLDLFDRKLIGRGRNQQTELRRLKAGATLDDLLSLADETITADLCQLSWLFHDRYARLFAHNVIVNPRHQWRGIGASADMLINGYLIDLKTVIHPRCDPHWLW